MSLLLLVILAIPALSAFVLAAIVVRTREGSLLYQVTRGLMALAMFATVLLGRVYVPNIDTPLLIIYALIAVVVGGGLLIITLTLFKALSKKPHV